MVRGTVVSSCVSISLDLIPEVTLISFLDSFSIVVGCVAFSFTCQGKVGSALTDTKLVSGRYVLSFSISLLYGWLMCCLKSFLPCCFAVEGAAVTLMR